jgi:hypothetical protein
VPALISGQIYNTGTKEIQIAVGVNDTIQAITNTLPVNEDTQSFSVLIPEAALRQGFNNVAIYQLPSCDSSLEAIPAAN